MIRLKVLVLTPKSAAKERTRPPEANAAAISVRVILLSIQRPAIRPAVLAASYSSC